MEIEYQTGAGDNHGMTYNLYLFALLIVTCCCTLFIAYLGWKRREFPISISYSLGMMAGAFYSFGYAFEIVSTSLEQIQFWLKIEYIGISFGTFFWIIMVLQYTGYQAFLRKWVLALLAVVPIITFISHYTNEWHHLFYKSMTLIEEDGFYTASLEAGVLYKLHVMYSYVIFVIGMILMICMYLKAPKHLRRHIAFMIIGSCGPYGITMLYLIVNFSLAVDISPFGFLFSGVFFMWGIYQFNFLKLAPLALEKVFESMNDAVIVFDLDNTITSYNQSARKIIIGLNDRRVIGQPAAQVFSTFPELLDRMNQVPLMESRVRISNGDNPRYYNVHVAYVSEYGQTPVGKMLLLSDVTEAVFAEETLRTNTRQLSELNTFKDRMFNVVAHDIRDPLAVLISLMELMREEMKTCGEDHEEIVDEMGQQIQNTFTLVESLLEWFKSQSGGMLFNPVVWNLSQAVQINMRLLQVRSGGKHIQITSSIPADMFVYADKEMLDLVIRNLLSNAIKFTEYNGVIEIGARQAEFRTIICVKDTGKGITEEQASKLFQESYPTSSIGTAGERGVGLGLTLCKEFVRVMGGDIWFDSADDQGSTFYFSIPSAAGASR